MKKIFFSFFCILFAASKADSQDFIVDSIRSVIQRPKTDRVRISALIQLAIHENGDLQNHDTALILLNDAYEFARQKKQPDLEVESLDWQSKIDYANNNSRKGRQLAQEAITVSRHFQLKTGEIRSLTLLGENLPDKPDSARLLMAQAMGLALKYDLVEEQLTILERTGDFYYQTKPDSARFYFLEELALARQSKMPSQEMSALQDLAITYADNHWGDSSKYLLREALIMARANQVAAQELTLLQGFTASRGRLGPFFLKDSLRKYYARMLELTRQLHKDSLQIISSVVLSWQDIGDFPKALQANILLLHAFEERKDTAKIEEILGHLIDLYQSMKQYKKSIAYCLEVIRLGPKNQNSYVDAHVMMADNYTILRQSDSARYYADQAYQVAADIYQGPSNVLGGVLNDLGADYSALGEDSLAADFLRRSFDWYKRYNDPHNYSETTLELAKYFKKKNLSDSSLYYARLAFEAAKKNGFLDYLSESCGIISAYYSVRHKIDSAFHYQQIGYEVYKTLDSTENIQQAQTVSFAEEQKEQDIAFAKEIADAQYRSNLRIYALITVLLVAMIIGLIVFRNSRQRQKAFELLKKQKLEIDQQKSKLETSLADLKSAQSQLIQSEKMASLGELTAGIAHEIQNPLNFVNNFSEVNKELLVELKEEMEKGNMDGALAIADDAISNEEKINHHGKRADAIVKGMLEHSRSGSGQKEPVNINLIADESMRLSYHGLRAKNKSFNVILKEDFDEQLDPIPLVRQDMLRVLVNLFNNAFYAVNEKSKRQLKGYEPTVSVSTKKTGDQAVLTIHDNGNGIPQPLLDKIFQPFFTTKPAGQGTGLGLSLSYDIIKAHGGKIQVKSSENEGSEFVLELPLEG